MGIKSGWQSTRIGAGSIPVESPEGWLLFYQGVLTSCNGFVYSYGAALLDLEEPRKIIHRGDPYLLSPKQLHECVGDAQDVVFPCAARADEPTGRIGIYSCAADTAARLAFASLDEVLELLEKTSEL